jgi:hypothetical protein
MVSEHLSNWNDRAWINKDAGGNLTTTRPIYDLVASLPKPPSEFPDVSQYPGDDYFGESSEHLATADGVTVTSPANELGSEPIEAFGWSVGFVHDAFLFGKGWHSGGRARSAGEPLVVADFTEKLIYDFGQTVTINTVTLWPRSDGDDPGVYFPQAFELQTSSNGTDWNTVESWDYDATNNTIYESLDPVEITLSSPVNTQHFRLLVTEITHNRDGNNYHVALAEVEIR